MSTKKQIYYHGTTADHLEDILQNGISPFTDKVWSCSMNEVYLWGVKELAKANDQLSDKKEYQEDAAFIMASESGQCSLAGAKDCRIVVIKIRLSPDEIENDFSCQNMENSGAVTINRTILPHEFEEVRVSNDLSLVKAYFISLIIDMDHCGLEFTALEEKIARGFKKAELYPEDIEEMIEWEPIVLNKLKTA